MQELSFTEENYIKAIYSLQQINNQIAVSVNEIADKVTTKPATVTDMLRKLSDKKLINYEKYKKPSLTDLGMDRALQVIRKHRLWEVFLHDKLNFSWDEVHEVAEELEHIRSAKLVERLDEYLGFPAFDPHGDPIPNAAGEIVPASNLTLSESEVGLDVVLVAVKDTSSAFLQYLERFGLNIGAQIVVKERLSFDGSRVVCIDGKGELMLSEKVAGKLLVK